MLTLGLEAELFQTFFCLLLKRFENWRGEIIQLTQYSVFPLLAFLCSLPVVPAVKKALLGRRGGKKRVFLVRAVSTALLFALSIVFLVGQSYNPFIYFRF